jgi:hypothetical protein
MVGLDKFMKDALIFIQACLVPVIAAALIHGLSAPPACTAWNVLT